jgi:hypothetical protein
MNFMNPCNSLLANVFGATKAAAEEESLQQQKQQQQQQQQQQQIAQSAMNFMNPCNSLLANVFGATKAAAEEESLQQQKLQQQQQKQQQQQQPFMDQRSSFNDNNHICEEPPKKQKVTTNMTSGINLIKPFTSVIYDYL